MAEQSPTTLEGWRAYTFATLSEAKEKCARTWEQMLDYQTVHLEDQPDICTGLGLELTALEHAQEALRRITKELHDGLQRRPAS
jgi:hypothetical protein